MPRIPQVSGNLDLATTSPDMLINPVLNEIAPDNSPLQGELLAAAPFGRVPIFTGGNTTSLMAGLHSLGDVIMTNDTYRNMFLGSLFNRIGRVIIINKMWSNPWKPFKKGLLEMGETIEEIFVEMAKPHLYNPEESEDRQYKRELPDVRAAFHSLNSKKFYKTTVQESDLRQAFLSWSGVSDLTAKIVESLYDGAEYDEFLVSKYLLCRLALDGFIHCVEIPQLNAANSNQIVTIIRGVSDKWEFKSDRYNWNGVKAYSKKPNQNIILDTDTNATVDVNSLASAFNLEYRAFLGKRVTVDSWSETDNKRLAQIFDDDPSYTPFTSAELAELDKIRAIMVDDNFFMIFDNKQEFTNKYNGEGTYWNYWFHTWQIYSASPFSNATIFANTTPSITSVQITPGGTPSTPKGSELRFSALVVNAGFANKGVIWELDGAEKSGTILLSDGTLRISPMETATSLSITATSIFDNSKFDDITVTLT